MKKTIVALVVAGLTLTACSNTAWNETENFGTYCNIDNIRIAPELQAAVDAVTIPEDGHIQNARWRTSNSEPGMHEVGFDVCTPLAGDDLRRVAEDLAIQVNAIGAGETVTTMGVHALPEDTEPETILRDHDFQLHLHNGVGDEGAVLSSWEAQN